MALIIIPLALIMAGTTSATLPTNGNRLRNVLCFVGSPLFALMVAALPSPPWAGCWWPKNLSKEAVNEPNVPAHLPETLLLFVANDRHSPSYG